MKTFGIILFASALVALVASVKATSRVIKTGEVLVYEMSYLGVPFAKMRIETLGEETVAGQKCVKTKAYAHSYGNLPKVNAQAKFEAWTNAEYGYGVKFTRNLKFRDKDWEFQEVYFDYFGDKTISNRKWVNKDLRQNAKIKITDSKRYFDPFSLFFFGRSSIVEKDRRKSAGTFFDGEPFYVSIVCSENRGFIRSGAFGDKKIEVIRARANADWAEGYGLKGEVVGYFTRDEARIPIKAEIDFIVGKIEANLIQVERTGYSPPYFKE